MLQPYHPVVKLTNPVMAIATWISPFADVPAFEIGAGRQDHIGELHLTLVPNGLGGDEFDTVVLVHLDVAVAVRLSANVRRAVFVDHMHF